MIKKNVIFDYAFYLFFKLVNGLLFSVAVYLFIDSDVLEDVFPIIIIQEFYFSYFYTSKKNKEISNNIRFGSASYLFLSTVLFISVLFYFELKLAFVIVLASSLFFFSFYAAVAPSNEKGDISRWVRIENVSSFFSACFVFIVLYLDSFLSIGLESVVLFRMGLFYILVLCWTRLKENDGFTLDFFTQNFKLRFFLEGVVAIAALFVIKITYFENALQTDKINGEQLKVFMLIYDFLAAIIALYIRRAVVKLVGKTKKYCSKLLSLNCFLFAIFIIAFKVFRGYEEVVLPLYILLTNAINFNLVSTLDSKRVRWTLTSSFSIAALLVAIGYNISLFIPTLISFLILLRYSIKKSEKS